MSTRNQRRESRERFWRRTLRQWRKSGLSVRAFCATWHVAEPTFYAWRRTLAVRDAEATRFVPVHVIPEDQASTAASSGSGLELVLAHGRRLRIGPDFEAATLRRLLALLEEGRP
jgi:transposase